MWKKVLLVSAVTGLLAAAAVPIQSTPADAGRSGCHKAAKAMFPADRKAREAMETLVQGPMEDLQSAQTRLASQGIAGVDEGRPAEAAFFLAAISVKSPWVLTQGSGESR